MAHTVKLVLVPSTTGQDNALNFFSWQHDLQNQTKEIVPRNVKSDARIEQSFKSIFGPANFRFQRVNCKR